MNTRIRDSRLLTLLLAALALAGLSAGLALAAKPKDKTVRVGVKANGKEVPMSNAEYIALSANGRLAAYEATGALVSKDNDEDHDVYVYDRVKRKNELVSLQSNGKHPKNVGCAAADISPNGRYVSFACDDALTGSDDNDLPDVYLRDLKSDKTTLISVKNNETQLNGVNDASILNGVSNNGRVAWESYGAFVNDDFNTAYDVFVRNPKAGTTKRASVDYQGNEMPNGVGSLNPDKATKLPISADGNFVAFTSPDKTTESTDYGFAVDTDVFLRNMKAKATTRISVKTNGDEASPNQNANSYMPSMSADGRYVAFQADPVATFAGADNNNGYDIYVRDRKRATTKLVSVKSDSSQPTPFGLQPQFEEISANGRYVVFDTQTNFGGGADPLNARDIYRRDIKSKKTKLISSTYKGKRGDDNQIADVSNNGFVGWQSMDQVVPGADDGNDWDVYLRGPIK